MIGEILLASVETSCGEKWNMINKGETITRQEFKVCKDYFKERYKKALIKELKKYNSSNSYCSDKWNEINYRRNPTLAERRLCIGEFEKYKKAEIKRKKELLKERGVN